MIPLRDFTAEMGKWITVVEGDFYPDAVDAAIPIYEGVIERFGELLAEASDAADLLRLICKVSQKPRIQLLRVFRKYVSPDTSVEMLKKKSKINDIIEDFGDRFRDIETVRARFAARPTPDEALIGILNEYRDRGQKGYELSEAFFAFFESELAEDFTVEGPLRAGSDINLHDCLPNYPKDRRPVDFTMAEKGEHEPIVVGLIRYDSDRGGAQEDDRTSGYRNVVTEVLDYSRDTGRNLKLLFVNDGPGLLLGSMWKDYCEIEDFGKGRVMVATLKMLPDRLTAEWLRS